MRESPSSMKSIDSCIRRNDKTGFLEQAQLYELYELNELYKLYELYKLDYHLPPESESLMSNPTWVVW